MLVGRFINRFLRFLFFVFNLFLVVWGRSWCSFIFSRRSWRSFIFVDGVFFFFILFYFFIVVVVSVWVVCSSEDRQWWLFLVFSGKVGDGHVGGPFEKEIWGRVKGFLGACKFVDTGNNFIGNRELGPLATPDTLSGG